MTVADQLELCVHSYIKVTANIAFMYVVNAGAGCNDYSNT